MKSGIASLGNVVGTLALIIFLEALTNAAQPPQFGRAITGITVGGDNIGKVRSLRA